jgi:hypothetical protein
MEQIEAGALHQMMDNPPPGDSAGIIWTTWEPPTATRELEHQRAGIEDAFRQGWRPIGTGQLRALTERACAQARAILSHGGWTGLDQSEPQSSSCLPRPHGKQETQAAMIVAECHQGMARQIRNATFTLVDRGS